MHKKVEIDSKEMREICNNSVVVGQNERKIVVSPYNVWKGVKGNDLFTSI